MSQAISQQLEIVLSSAARFGLWFAILCVIFIPVERLFPVRRQSIFRRGIWTDLGYFVLSSVLPPVLLTVPVGFLVVAIHRLVPYHLYTLASHWPFWSKAIVGLVIGDIAYYWAHRWMHVWPWLWRFHAIHHSSREIDFLVSTRMHPVDLFLSRFSGLVPLYALGLIGPIDADSVWFAVVFIMLGKLWGFFIHANLRLPFGSLAWVLTTPGFHHWHHALTPANRNYASMLPWLDRLFGTYHAPAGESPRRYGIDQVVPEDLPRQFGLPFVQDWSVERPQT